MAPCELPDDLPGNLSRQAADDLVQILRRSAWDFGVATARRSRLLARIRAVEDGTALGHPRPDVKTRAHVLFLIETPWILAYDPATRQVLRILHGARDVPRVFDEN